jgi:hypothetical protein
LELDSANLTNSRRVTALTRKPETKTIEKFNMSEIDPSAWLVPDSDSLTIIPTSRGWVDLHLVNAQLTQTAD